MPRRALAVGDHPFILAGVGEPWTPASLPPWHRQQVDPHPPSSGEQSDLRTPPPRPHVGRGHRRIRDLDRMRRHPRAVVVTFEREHGATRCAWPFHSRNVQASRRRSRDARPTLDARCRPLGRAAIPCPSFVHCQPAPSAPEGMQQSPTNAARPNQEETAVPVRRSSPRGRAASTSILCTSRRPPCDQLSGQGPFSRLPLPRRTRERERLMRSGRETYCCILRH